MLIIIIIIIDESGCDIDDENDDDDNNCYVYMYLYTVYIDRIVVCRAESCLRSHRRRAYRSAAHREHYAYVRGISSYASERSCERR